MEGGPPRYARVERLGMVRRLVRLERAGLLSWVAFRSRAGDAGASADRFTPHPDPYEGGRVGGGE